MTDDERLAEIRARLMVRNMSASRSAGHMSEMDAVEAHKGVDALLALVEALRRERDVARAKASAATEMLAASIASEARLMARVAELEAALTRQADNVAFVLNRCPLPEQWFDRFDRELREDRKLLPPAPARPAGAKEEG